MNYLSIFPKNDKATVRNLHFGRMLVGACPKLWLLEVMFENDTSVNMIIADTRTNVLLIISQ